jgi:hypothetical protein
LKNLLIAKATVEMLIGLALLLVPVLVVSLLFGAPLDDSAGTVVARMTGAALLAMGIACWLARNDITSHTAKGLVVALLFYDAAVVVIFLFARFAAGLAGIGLWPAVAIHSGLGVWSLFCLRRTHAE